MIPEFALHLAALATRAAPWTGHWYHAVQRDFSLPGLHRQAVSRPSAGNLMDAFHGHAARPHSRLLRRSPALLAQARLHQLWRTGRADCHHAPRAGGAAPLDQREALPARAELLHAAARPRGAAAGHLHRLADAPHLGRHRGGCAVRAALAVHPDRPELGLCGLWQRALGGRAVLRHQAGGGGHRAAGGAPHRQQDAEDTGHSAGALGHRRAQLHRHCRSENSVSLGRAGRGADRLARLAGSRPAQFAGGGGHGQRAKRWPSPR